jgi:hypothetical protein
MVASIGLPPDAGNHAAHDGEDQRDDDRRDDHARGDLESRGELGRHRCPVDVVAEVERDPREAAVEVDQVGEPVPVPLQHRLVEVVLMLLRLEERRGRLRISGPERLERVVGRRREHEDDEGRDDQHQDAADETPNREDEHRTSLARPSRTAGNY